VADAVSLLGTFEFNTLELSRDDLVHVLLAIFQSSTVLDKMVIPEAKAKRLILAVRGRMSHVPFHNFWHVCDMVQYVYALVAAVGLHDRLSRTEQLALVVSALCHDVEHPGVANVGLVGTVPRIQGFRVWGGVANVGLVDTNPGLI
jgi:hypothetical protein